MYSLRLALALAVAVAAGCRQKAAPARATDAPPSIDWSRTAPVGIIAQPTGYVGAAACTRCHQKEARAWSRRPMGNTGLRPLDAERLRALAPALKRPQSTQDARGRRYVPRISNGKLVVEERLEAPDGTLLHRMEIEPTHTFTSGTFAWAFAVKRGGRFYQLPIDYYPEAKQFGLDPGFVGDHARFAKPLAADCLGCHSDFPAHLAGMPEAPVSPSEGIGCERCHGPGARHIATGDPDDIVNPAHLPPQRQLDVCAQCHLTSTAEILRAGKGPYDYRPGTPLATWRVLFVERDADPGTFRLGAQVDRLTRSACFLRSKGRMTCTTCHDPHARDEELAAGHMRTACLKCHDCPAPAKQRAQVDDACPRCHMRRDTPDDFPLRNQGVALPMTDHFIRRKIDAPAPTGGSSPSPSRELVVHDERMGGTVAGPDVAATRAVALGDESAMAEAERAGVPLEALWKAVGMRAAFAHREARDPEIRAEAGRRWLMARRQMVRLQPDQADALVGYARVELNIGNDEREAIRALDRALTISPGYGPALEEKAGWLFRSGRREEAVPLLTAALEAAPTTLQANVLLGVIARDAGRDQEAIARFVAARRAEPTDPWLVDQLVLLYRRQKDAAALADAERMLAMLGGPPAGETPASRLLRAPERKSR